MRKALLLAGAILIGLPAWSQYVPYSGQLIVSSQGAKVGSYGQITVCGPNVGGSPCTPANPVYSNATGSGGPLTQPFSADGNGNYTFYAPQGQYTISACIRSTICQSNQVTIGASADTGLQVYNVKAYGATGNGTTDDTAALTSTWNICNSNSGTIFLPVGAYLISASLPIITNSACSIMGAGQYASRIVTTTTTLGSIITIQPSSAPNPPANYTAQYFEHFGVDCDTAATVAGPFYNVAFHLIDATMTKWFDVGAIHCAAAWEEENLTYDSERNEFINWNSTYNQDSFLLKLDASDSNTSFLHQTWIGGYVATGTAANESVFHLENGAALLDSHIEFNGNIYGPSTNLFLFDSAGSTNGGSAIVNSTIKAMPEDNGTATIMFKANGTATSGTGPCNSTSPCFLASGHMNKLGTLSSGSFAFLQLKDSYTMPNYITSLTTTAAATDTVTNAAILSNTLCFAVPTDAAAAGMSGVYITLSNPVGSVVVNHPATANAHFGIWCQ